MFNLKNGLVFILFLLMCIAVINHGLMKTSRAKVDIAGAKSGIFVHDIKKAENLSDKCSFNVEYLLERHVPIGSSFKYALQVFQDNGFEVESYKRKLSTDLYATRYSDGGNKRRLGTDIYTFYLKFEQGKLKHVQEAEVTCISI